MDEALGLLTTSIELQAWRHVLQIVLDGLRRERSAPTPLLQRPLDLDETRAAMIERDATRQRRA